jgi:hypothetical protein
MQTTDQIIDEILLKSPYGAKAYEARHKRLIEKEEVVENEITDHPQQTYLNFEKDNHE